MYKQIVVNVTIAFVWMFFFDSWNFSTFFLGYLLGLALIFVLRRFMNEPFYFRKVIAVIKLLLLFLKELILSSWAVFKEIVRPKLDIRPGIIAVPTRLRSDWEITTFAMLITLTPGTLTLEVSPEQDVLYIHAMDIEDTEKEIEQLKNTFENAIMEVSR